MPTYQAVKPLLLPICAIIIFMTSCKKSSHESDPPVTPKITATQVITNINQALSGKDTLSQFAAQVKVVSLTDAEVKNGITVFAPSNKAYTLKTASLHQTAVAADYLPDSSLVTDYIVAGELDAATFTDGTSLTALSGKQLTLTKKGSNWLLNGVFLNITKLSSNKETVVFGLAGLLNASALPKVTGVSDLKTFPGWLLTVYGHNFGTNVNNNLVKIDGVAATVHTAWADSLLITVPQGVAAGNLTVTTRGRTISAPEKLTVQQAQVATITGTGGGPIQGVTIDAADNVFWTDNSANPRLVEYSNLGHIDYYQPTFANPNGDGTFIPAYRNTFLWSIAVNSTNQLIVANQKSGQLVNGYGGLFLTNEGSLTTAEWWAGSNAVSADANAKDLLSVASTALMFDHQNNLYLSNTGGVQRILPGGQVSYIVKNQAFKNADPLVANDPGIYGLVLLNNSLYITDANNGRIWVNDATGLHVVAGNNTHVAKDGVGTDAQFGGPFGMASDKKGNLYVCDNDYANSKFLIRMINPMGVVTTIAGGQTGNKDGIGSASGFDGVNCIAANSKGVFYIGTDVGVMRTLSIK